MGLTTAANPYMVQSYPGRTLLAARPKAFSYLRISSPEQAKGHGIQRQLEASRRWAKEHGYDLLEGDELIDRGVSAFKGKNLDPDAQFGRFLDAVKARKVPAGSVLIVESIDRISRQKAREAAPILFQIINAYVNICDLSSGRVYTADTTELGDIIVFLLAMERAHQESVVKSMRISAAWAEKRKNAATRKLTSIAPAWLKLSKDRSKFEIIESRAAVVRTIFEDCANGMGCYTLERRLNANRVPSFGRGGTWHRFYVRKLLSSRTVLGEYQPHRRQDGRRVPDGDAVTGYYPRIVSDELFYKAQAAVSQRRTGSTARKGTRVNNVFSGLLSCAYCRGPFKYENKGASPRGGSYLVCDATRRGLGCTASRWRYEDFEVSFLAFCSEVDLERVIRGDDESKRSSIEAMISVLMGELSSIDQQMERTYELLKLTATDSKFIASKIQQLEKRRAEVEKELKEKERERAGLEVVSSSSIDEVKDLVKQIQGLEGDEAYRLRSRLTQKIRSLVSSILIAPQGHEPIVRQSMEVFRNHEDAMVEVFRNHEEVMAKLKGISETRDFTWQHFIVQFIDGTSRLVHPDPSDPLKIRHEVYS
jgi:DNA invertase Pin-like site-specific DNA recombinase